MGDRRAESPTYPLKEHTLKHFLMKSTVILTPAFCVLSALALAQTPSTTPPVSSVPSQETQQNQKSKVILRRSIDENGQTVDGASPQTTPAGQPPKIAAQPTAEDAERSALTTTAFDLDVRLRPAESHIAVRALITVRNDGKTPLAHIPLQLSSGLNWEQIRLNGRQAPFTVAVLNSLEDLSREHSLM